MSAGLQFHGPAAPWLSIITAGMLLIWSIDFMTVWDVQTRKSGVFQSFWAICPP